MGFDVDVVAPEADLAGYSLVLAPSLPVATETQAERFASITGAVVIGPRSGSKTRDLQIPPNMPPGPLQQLVPIRVARVESLRPGWTAPGPFKVERWLEHIDSALEPAARTAGGTGIWYRSGRTHYIACWPDAALLDTVLREAASQAALQALDLPDGLRLRRRGNVRFAINYAPEAVDLREYVPGADGLDFMLGGMRLGPAGVSAWRET